MEGSLRSKIDWAIAYSWKEIYRFTFFTLYLGVTSKYKPPRGLILGGAIYRRVFCGTGLGGLIFWRAYTFTVVALHCIVRVKNTFT